ncbi:MAG: glycosyl transferase [Clostridia bacterium]|nr:glycosyl transferase [Clostridia bacterium]
MQLYYNTVIGIGIIIIFIILLFLLVYRSREKRIVKIHDASLTCEELEQHAKEIAFEHIVSPKAGIANWPLPRMNENYSFIMEVYKELNEGVQKKRTIPPAAEWLLDNFYIIEEQVKGIRRDLTREDYARLPALKCGAFRGYARIYAVAMELVAHTNGQIDERILLNYIKAYQSHSILTDREIWALPAMIRIALIENIRYICEKLRDTQEQWQKADELMDILLDESSVKEENSQPNGEGLIKTIGNRFESLREVNPSFIEHLTYRLRRAGRSYARALRYIDENLERHGTGIDTLTQKEHNSQAVSTVSIGNCIISLKFISNLDWVEIFESTSFVDQILNRDPDGTYPLMDLPSRNIYRKKVEELALLYNVSEMHVAKEAVELAGNICTVAREGEEDTYGDALPSVRSCHVGYYLIGRGITELEKRMGYKPAASKKAIDILKRRPKALYMGSIVCITILITLILALYIYRAAEPNSLLLAVIAGIAALVPSSEIAVTMVNWLVCSIIKPVAFPRLELKDGIPGEYATVIVIPALLPDEKRVAELLENLETHYLANKEKNLYFALAGDFKDSSVKEMPGDEQIIKAGVEGVKELNRKYSNGRENVFFFFHRERKLNKKENKWMGWERKRGALVELNSLLLGSEKTSYSYVSSADLTGKPIKYIITLDADTILPIDGAKKMIGTMAHPLNRPVIHRQKNIVVDGYGLIQPRIGFEVESANKSLFSRIYTGQEGIDPYACAISDIYQDLFGEGIFTGKGIYDLRVFHRVLENALPDNSVLSHDLLEGSYVRTGLVTDIELIDSYPSRYNSYAARMHRWVRGDWQLIPWIGSRIIDRNGNRIANPLSAVSRWKIADNLRRSLVAPSMILATVLGFSIMPGTGLFWLFFLVLTLIFPLVTSVIDTLLSKPFGTYRVKRHVPVISGLKATILQIALVFVFLPYQAYLMVNAIFITLVRVIFTRKNMLEWVTAADVERGQKNSLYSYIYKMRSVLVIALATGILSFSFKPVSLVFSLPLVLIWIASPYVAYLVSKNEAKKAVNLSQEDVLELRRIARKTWRYFEEFMNSRNHYLPPDNYQEDPPNGVAYRTSPTNIGLGLLAALIARDMGYIGTYEMTGIISNTVTTMEKMEKWNGHLYNWYDTRTLHPLRPRYISTVDSGNMVCYLITLVQGLEGYLKTPLIDPRFIDGIKDTVSLYNSESSKNKIDVSFLDNLKSGGGIDSSMWGETLEQLSKALEQPESNVIHMHERGLRRSKWKTKTDHMINAFKRELSELMPWYEFLINMPQDERLLEGIVNRLLSDIPLGELPDAYANVVENVENAIVDMRSGGAGSSDKSIVWLYGLKDAVVKAKVNTEKFIQRYRELIGRIKALSDGTEFLPLYVEKKQLFSIGYNIEENRLTNSFYDLLASEARQTSYIAIARGEVSPKHWFKMGRALTVVDHYKGLVSWTGTMFEYLMPPQIMKTFKNTLLDETYSFVIRSQKKYGKQKKVPWGVSESGFYSLDINLDYQYKAIGVPWLGLKRGLIEDTVVAPYATFLALPLDPAGAMENIKRLKAEGLDGPYGYYEAVDYTPERLPFGEKRAIVKSFMVHHEGMSLLGLNNFLNDGIMQKRFHSDPLIKAAQLLLQEKVPTNIVFTKENKEKVILYKDVVFKEKGAVRKFNAPDNVLPRVHILSNGNYSVAITDKGTGYSRSKTASVTRWREDSTLDNYGTFFYIRNLDTGREWTAAYSPYNIQPDSYEVVFTSDKVKFKRKDGDIETHTEIVVTSGDNAEIRRVSLKNSGETPCILEVTSYLELVIAPHSADVAHPAFSNLFVRTEFLHDSKSILANRRPRSEADKSLWALHTAVVEGDTVGDVEFETDRMQFIGRGHTVANPVSMERNRPVSNSTGPVLDPVMSLRYRVKVEPGQVARISYITAISENRDIILELIEKYSIPEAVDEAFRLAMTRSQVETRYLNIKASEIELYQDMISHILFISPQKRNIEEYLMQSIRGQSALWPYGISGDIPIMLVVLKETDEIDIIYEALKAHEYWRLKDLRVDMVILNEEENSYTHPLHSLLADVISSSHARDIVNKPGGVFMLNINNVPQEDITLLHAVARIILRGNYGSLAQQVKVNTDNRLPELKNFCKIAAKYPEPVQEDFHLQFFNGIGGFKEDGKEYVIRLEKGQNTPLPWINVIANPHFGFIVSEAGSSYTWSENSRENKLTPWSNDPVSDIPGEVLYIGDSETGEVWNITPLPVREAEPYTITHGFGYSVFEHTSHGIEQKMTQFLPIDGMTKINMINLKNISDDPRELTLTYYIRPVLGVSDQATAMHIKTSLSESGTLLVENPYNEEFAGRVIFIDTSEKERSVTGDRKEFFGLGKLTYPEALKRQKLSGRVGKGYDPCAAMQISITLSRSEEKKIIFLLGAAKDKREIDMTVNKYKDIKEAGKALDEARKFWQHKLEAVSVNTPDQSMNFMLNGWLMYQTVCCRMWARSAFYQSGGAYGFRDQLQDSLSVAHIWPELTQNQILLHSKHQFIEGDVQHWWHEPEGKGTRTRFSDDLLWLPYVTAEYVRISEDWDILDKRASFLEDEQLKEFEDERYTKPRISSEEGNIYEHCIRSIERSLRFGGHGLPLMGSGDWNDGMSTVGNKGKGESVWLGWFLYSTLVKFEPICRKMGDEKRAERYSEISKTIIEAIERNAWDGSWYRRAYFDSGIPLGSVQNSECKIDSISQSWAVISGGANSSRMKEAMDSLDKYLVQRDDGLIKLLTPPFDEGDLEPGYIKSYVPGVRENGGQYTHAAAWVIIALAKLGNGDKAWELFDLINPINHTRTHMEYTTYKVEPYVMAADVYAVPPHVGRGGWTWYTGSSGWMYRAGMEYILGFHKNGDKLVIDPCIPKRWSEYSIKFRYMDTFYDISIHNPNGVNSGVANISLDGTVSGDKAIRLVNDGKNHQVEVVLG